MPTKKIGSNNSYFGPEKEGKDKKEKKNERIKER